ncbi:MAG: glucose-6-phosphate dehydrogenase [Candidatus Sungbacteria bacterium]|nr:glucose-6-phosphate dehydrogenase [Candidatus Sungbacteria bacterium]
MPTTPTILVIFGATGDLTRRKIVPALWHLFREKKLPPSFSVIGFSRRDLGEEAFRASVDTMVATHRATSRSKGTDTAFINTFTYVRGFFDKKEAYLDLKKKIEDIERASGARANRLFYLAVTPDMYETVLNNIARSGIGTSESDDAGWARIIVEKPFGRDAKTARELDELLASLFHEQQIYRIDHYLAKEMVQNILAFRFSNNLFERNWSRETIERIDVRLWEKLGVEERGTFYDGVGALRDVGQNHLLQMLALIAMDRPENFGASALRRNRAAVLRALATPSRKEIMQTSVRAQYEGYRAIAGVAPDSDTETYFRTDASVASARWKGVRFTLESGKRMHERQKEMVITFRHPTPCLCPPESGQHFRNKIILSLEPEERITIHFWSKKPGFAYDLEERTLTFLLRGSTKRAQYVEEYKKLLLDCITGDQTLFVSTEEVREMWRFTDPIVDAWRKGLVPLGVYRPDTDEAVMSASRSTVHPSSEVSAPKMGREIGLIGLGKMGAAMAERLCEKGWRVVAYDRDHKQTDRVARYGAQVARDLEDLVRRLPRPRAVWLMVPAGTAVDDALFGAGGLTKYLSRGDTVIDGGNSFYEDTRRRAKKLKSSGIRFLDVGVSGGPGGARHGACLMVGGEQKDFQKYENLFRDLALEGGYARLGAMGAGHFAKMVHNGIEYGMMQSLAEGFAQTADVYNSGSVIESRLVGWLRAAYEAYGEDLKEISGTVGHTGEGEWTVKTAKKMGVSVPAIKTAFDFRVKSKKRPDYTGKILSALRNQFGGHRAK